MLADRANSTLSLGESLTLSGIGMLVVFLELILLAVVLMFISKAVARLTAKRDAAAIGVIGSVDGPTAIFVAGTQAAAPVPAVTLYKVDEPTAAVLMALVAHQSGIDPRRLDFKSIRLIEED